MSLIFDTNMSARMVKESVQRLRDDAEKKRRRGYDFLENFAVGGDLTKRYVKRHSHEEDKEYEERLADFAHWGYTGRVRHALASGLYGHEVTRKLLDGTDQHNENLAMMYEESRFSSSGQRLVADGVVTLGDCFVFPAWSSSLDLLMHHVVHPSNCFVEPHPDDPYRELTWVEERVNPNKVDESIFWVWKDEAFCVVDESERFVTVYDLDGNEVVAPEWNENPYGFIPAVHFAGLRLIGSYWSMSPLRDVVHLNKEINNRASILGMTIKRQGFSIPVLRDQAMKPGPDGLVFSEAKTINIADPNGDFFFAAPNAPITAVQDTLKELIDRLFEVGGIPTSIVRGGSAASGYQLEVEYRTMSEIVKDMATEAKNAEEDLAWKSCQIANVHRPGSFPDDPDTYVDIDVELVPRNESEERDRDLLDVQHGLMKKAEYVKKWHPEVEDPEAYLAEIAAEPKPPSPFETAFGGGESLL